MIDFLKNMAVKKDFDDDVSLPLNHQHRITSQITHMTFTGVSFIKNYFIDNDKESEENKE